MASLLSRSLLVAALACLCAGTASAQQRPTADQARELLATRPDLVKQLQDRLAASGMTRDQIRARLRAEGYPEDLLDAYYPGSTEKPTSVGADVFQAVEALGIVDDAGMDSLRLTAGLPPRRRGFTQGDSTERGRVARKPVVRPRTKRPVNDSVRVIQRPWYDERLPDTLKVRRPIGDTTSAMGLAEEDSTELDSLTVFGVDVFQRETSQFDPNLAGPVDAGYRLGPGDKLVLVLTGDVEASYTLEVTRQGFIVVPQVGEINVANLSLGQLEDVLYSRLGRVYSGVRRGATATTHFSISPSRLRTNQIYVIGDVVEPGSYRVSASGTALTALYAAGGPTDVGSLRRIEIRRGGRAVDVLDVYDYLLRGDASHDPRLENGDVVFVPVHGPRIRVEGQVVRPAIYEMKPGETLADALRAAGGFRAEADRGRVQIERILASGGRAPGRARTTIDVAGDQLAAGNVPALGMENGDIVRVFAVSDRMSHRVSVRGNVWTPGRVGFEPGMKLSDALRLAGGLKPDTYLGQILVSRLREDSTRVQLRASLRDTTGTVIGDIALADNDDIRVFAATEFRPNRYVTILGAVRRSGRYPYREGMTMRDLVLLAGGLKESASLQAAEIARVPEDRSGGKLARTVRVPLDSSYVFDEHRDGVAGIAQAGAANGGSGAGAETRLAPYDNVLIMEQPDWDRQRTVTVVGEVMQPGTYSLTSKNDRLRDVIERAGGLTKEGYADGVVFYRKNEHVGRVGVDLARVLRDGRADDNITLQDGDSIFIPTYTGTVIVGGAVNSPTAVAYVPGANIDYYINAAGGLSAKGELSRAYVTQPNGKVESRKRRLILPDGKPHPRAGSEVTVPLRDTTARGVDLQPIISLSLQVIGLAITAYAVLRR